jgi:D-amino-acid oxidase
MNILVIGCGVSGLTSALCLLESGHSVSIWAKQQPPHTTSNVAAAIWYPYKAYPPKRVTAWGEATLRKLEELRSEEGSGIIMASFLEVKPTSNPEDPWWARGMKSFRQARPEELPEGYPGGYTFEAPVIDTGVYLDFLVNRFQAQGGQIQPHVVNDLTEAFTQSNIVVNCSGLGARELVGDRDLHPARGQVVRIKHNGFRSTEEDPQETQNILRRCANLAPEFATITTDDIERVVCGLRPVRSTVRVEAERIAPDRLLVHNYGHGGAGITLSWGCAIEVAELVTQVTK